MCVFLLLLFLEEEDARRRKFRKIDTPPLMRIETPPLQIEHKKKKKLIDVNENIII